MVSVGALNGALTISCMAGLALSIYAYVIELAIQNDKNYKALCDIDDNISCTKAFKSSYGKGFGLFPEDSFFYKPNSLVGILFYSLTATLAQSTSQFITKLFYVLVVLSNFASIYFAYILYFKLYNFCVICVATYVVNFINLIVTKAKMAMLKKMNEVDQRKKRN